MNQTIINSVTEVTYKLSKLAKEEGLDVHELVEIWAFLPIADASEIDFGLVKNWIFQISDLVDRNSDLPADLKIAKKYRLMATLLNAKAKLIHRTKTSTFQAQGRLYFGKPRKNS